MGAKAGQVRPKCLPGCLCKRHTNSGNRRGNPIPLKERLISHRRITEEGCYEWTGSRWKGARYGKIKYKRKWITPHRLIGTLLLGYVPGKGLVTSHKCNNPLCFRPSHLLVTTQKENLKYMRECKRSMWDVNRLVPVAKLQEWGIDPDTLEKKGK